jgi:hypothetical protein
MHRNGIKHVGFRRKKKINSMHRERCFHKKSRGRMQRNEIRHVALRRQNKGNSMHKEKMFPLGNKCSCHGG